jgi:hypothetical protein
LLIHELESNYTINQDCAKSTVAEYSNSVSTI